MSDELSSVFESLFAAIPFIVFGVLLIKSKDQTKSKETGTPTDGVEILFSFFLSWFSLKILGYAFVLLGLSFVAITFLVNFL